MRLKPRTASPDLLTIPPDRGLRQGENGTKSPSEYQAEQASEVQCGLSIVGNCLVWRIGADTALTLTADQADELSADLRRFALELRCGGKLT